MPTPITPEPVPLPLPTLGYNCRDSLHAMPPEYCALCENFDLQPQFPKIRGSYVLHQTISVVAPVTTIHIMAIGVRNNKLYAMTYSPNPAFGLAVYDITSTPSVVVAVYAGSATRFSAHNYGGRIGFFANSGASADSRMYDGTAWAVPGFTYAAAAMDSQVAVSYRDVMYFFATTTGTMYMYYGATSAVMGALTRVDLTTIFRKYSAFAWAGVLTTPQNRAIDSLLAIGTTEGEILLYTGANPGATDWQLVARFETGRPLYWNSAIEVGGDIYVLTEIGVVSIRALLDSGDDNNDDITISGAINPLIAMHSRKWIQSGGDYLFNTRASIAHAKDQNKIYFYLKGYLDPLWYLDTSSEEVLASAWTTSYDTILIYNTVSGSWSTHKITAIIGSAAYSTPSMTYFNGTLYFAADKYIIKYDPTSFADQQTNGTYTQYYGLLNTAYTNLGTYNRNKQVEGVEIVCQTDFSSEALVGGTIAVKVASDFNRQESSYNFAPYPSLQDGYNQITFSVGVKGTYLQAKLQVTATSQDAERGFQLYSIGLIVK